MKRKIAITHEEQPCRNCSTPVLKKSRRKAPAYKPGRKYYFPWWFHCPTCLRDYHVDGLKIWFDQPSTESVEPVKPTTVGYPQSSTPIHAGCDLEITSAALKWTDTDRIGDPSIMPWD